MAVSSTWLTASRVRRLPAVLAVIPERPPGLPHVDARLPVWRNCGGPIEDIPRLVETLLRAELIRSDAGRLRLTPAGRSAVSRQRADVNRRLALALIRAGLMHDQARVLLDSFPANSDGSMTCRLADARRCAPQLVGLLQAWPEVRRGSDIAIPAELLVEFTAVWALIAPRPDDGDDIHRRWKSIGDRAEAYSYQLERLLAERPSSVVWVAQDDDNLGYDIEDRSVDPRRRIEVKGSGGPDVRFFMSANEWRKAHENPSTYEVHFWGEIDLNHPPANEYDRLRAKGYPFVFRQFPTRIDSGELAATPDRWRVVSTSPPRE